MCMKTYFSDNSLLPGLVQREFSFDHEAQIYLEELNSITRQENDKFSTAPLLFDYLSKKLNSFGLAPYKQHFTYKQKFQTKLNQQPHTLLGHNLYSIIRAERAQTSEAVVLCATYSHDIQYSNLPGISLILALTKYFVSRNYWSKDVIILFTDHNNYGTSAWLDAYHNVNYDTNTTTNKFPSIQYDQLDYRSGPILAAINLELHGKQIEHLNIKIEGLNGQLPNLDLFNLVVEMTARESITPKFHGYSLPFALSTQELYYSHLHSVLSMMKTQASMSINGAHALFQKYSIQSLTLEGFQYRRTGKNSVMLASTLNVGRLLEGIFRSLNNLIERFNRSYYFYLLPSLRRFVSIGYYMIVFGLMTIPLILKSLRIYQDGIRLNENSTKDGRTPSEFNLWEGAISCAKAQVLACLLYMLPSSIIFCADLIQLEYGITLGEMISTALIMTSFLLPQLYESQSQSHLDFPSPRLLAALLNLALVLTILSLINISLALFLSLSMIPIALLVSPRKNIVLRNLNRIILLLIHPLILGLMSVTIFNYIKFPERQLIENIKRSTFQVSGSITNLVEEYFLFGNWGFIVGPLLYPVWIQLWSVL